MASDILNLWSAFYNLKLIAWHDRSAVCTFNYTLEPQNEPLTYQLLTKPSNLKMNP